MNTFAPENQGTEFHLYLFFYFAYVDTDYRESLECSKQLLCVFLQEGTTDDIPSTCKEVYGEKGNV